MNEGQWATKKLLEVLRRSNGWALGDVKNAMVTELSALAEKMKMPGCSVVTVGDTGVCVCVCVYETEGGSKREGGRGGWWVGGMEGKRA